MKQLLNRLSLKSAFLLMLTFLIFITACEKSDEEPDKDPPMETGSSKSFNLFLTSTQLPGGTIKFSELDDGTIKIKIDIFGLDAAASHPAHIHNNSGAEGGGIAISLEKVDGSTGESETIISTLDNGTTITYEELIDFDGHVNVHQSESDLGTLVAQGDIGPNEFTLNIEDYDLFEVGGSGIEGDVTFIERVSGEILAIISLENTPSGGEHPAHVHLNSAAIGGGIAISLSPIDGDNGFSLTDFNQLDDGTAITFSQVKDFDGHVKVHLSASELGTVVTSGDIGGNVFTDKMEVYALNEKAIPGIGGTATFKERKNGKTLVEIKLNNTPADGDHPAHIHNMTAAEGGGVAFPLSNIDGNTGMSLTDIAMDGNQNPVTYDDLITYDGYINVHLSSGDLATIVSQGDIGGNVLTGTSIDYPLSEGAVPGISGMATFSERKNGNALVTLMLENTPQDGVHPAHIHLNSAAEGGGIFVALSSVDGSSGKSMSTPRQDDSGLIQELPYEFLIIDDIHIKVHLSAEALGTVVAVGDAGGNKLTGEESIYEIAEIGASGVSGTFTLAERMNGNTLASLSLTGTPVDGDHPAHIHDGSVENPGGIVIPLNNVDGNTGNSMTHIEKNSSDEDVSYDDLIGFNGHVKVHLSPADLGTVVAAGNIGGNSGARISYANDIRPILDTNCQVSGCHGSNGGIPSFATYENVSANAAKIKNRTGNGIMPPTSSGKTLSTDQVNMISDWVDDGAMNN